MFAPMLIPLAALIVGILAARMGAGMLVASSVGLLAAGAYFFVIKLTKNAIGGFKLNPLHYSWIGLIFLCIGIFDYTVNKPFVFEYEKPEIISVSGRIKSVSSPVTGDKAVIRVSQFITADARIIVPDNCDLLLCSDALDCCVGDIVRFDADVFQIDDNPNKFSNGYADRMRNLGINYQSIIEGKDLSTIGHRHSYASVAASTRDKLEAFIEKRMISKRTQKFLITILLGDRSYLDPDTRYLFADAGISHVLALSGLHVAIISSLILLILFPLNFFGYYRYKLILSALLLFAYAFLTGWNPSTVRATFMMMALTTCIIIERKNSAWNSLLLAVFIILLVSPIALFDIGMQLSFVCVASLIFFVNKLNPISHRRHHILYAVSKFLLVSIVATVATWCITAWYFGRIPVMFLPANIIILPLLPIYLTIAIIYFILAACGMESGWMAVSLDFFPRTIFSAIEWIKGAEPSSIQFTPSTLDVALWMLLVSLLAVWLNTKKKKLIGWSCIGVLALFAVSVTFSMRADYEDFIIQRQLNDIRILSRDRNKKETIYNMPRKAVSKLTLAQKNILVLDAPVDSLSNGSYDLILLSSGCKSSIRLIDSIYKPCRIVILSNIRRKREAGLIAEADSMKVSVHSIRRDGPLRLSKHIKKETN